MVNINQNENENENEKFKLSPLGTDEINSVIKSFKTSKFNQEELYKNDKKNFVKKTLFDLAKESERISSEESQSEIDVSRQKKDLDKNEDLSQEIIEELDGKSEIDVSRQKKDLDKNEDLSQETVNKSDEKDDFDNIYSLNEISENDEIKDKEEENLEGNVSDSIKSDEALEENIDQNVKGKNEKNFNTKSTETNKIEYEEKTLEALDSVREAVTKSLEENIETQNEEITKNTDTSKNLTNDVVSEINLINSLFKNIREISNEEIENIVKSKVIELAEGVIGYQIEKFPDKFLKLIKNNINEIKGINNDIKIYLNKKDFDLLSKFIESHNTEVDFKLDLDSSLGRGDFTIDMGGVVQAIKYKKVIE